MKIIFIFILLLLSFAARAQTITGVAIETNGWQALVFVSGLNTNGTYNYGLKADLRGSNILYSGTEKLRLTVTSQGFDDTGTATTIQRDCVGTYRVRFPYPGESFADEVVSGGGIRLRIALDKEIYAGDSNITATFLSGLYSQGGSNTPAVSGVSVTNLSAYTYPRVSANWLCPDCETATNTLTVRAYADHQWATKGRPIRAAGLVVTDGTTTTTNFVTQMTRDRAFGDALPVVEYIWNVSTTPFAAKSNLTVNARFYPWIGDATSVVDSATEGFAWPSGNIRPLTFVCDKSQTYGGSYALVDTAASDATGYATNFYNDSSPPTAFRTISGAAKAIALYNGANFGGRTNCGNSTIYLESGSHAWTGTNIAVTQNPMSYTYLTVTRRPSVARSNVIISAQSGSTAIGGLTKASSIKTKIKDVTITAAAATTWSLIEGLIFDTVEFNTSYATLINQCWWSVVRSDVTYLGQGFTPNATLTNAIPLIRGNRITRLGQATVPWVFTGNYVDDTNSAGALSFVYTAYPSAPQVPIIVNNRIHRWNSTAASAINLANETNEFRCVVVQNEIENIANGPAAQIQIGPSTPTTNIIIRYNTFVGQRQIYGYNTAGTTLVNHLHWRVQGNIEDDRNIKGDLATPPNGNQVGNWVDMWGVGWTDSWCLETGAIQPTSAFLGDFHGMNSRSYTDNHPTTFMQFVNRQAADGTNSGAGLGDYHLRTTGPASNWQMSDWWLPYDLDGAPRGLADPPGCYVYGSPKRAGF